MKPTWLLTRRIEGVDAITRHTSGRPGATAYKAFEAAVGVVAEVVVAVESTAGGVREVHGGTAWKPLAPLIAS